MRRRGDRIEIHFAAVHESGFWRECEVPTGSEIAFLSGGLCTENLLRRWLHVKYPVPAKNPCLMPIGVHKLRQALVPMTRCRTPVSYTHLRAHETRHDIVCRL